MLVIGLTGLIGSGKSTVANIFANLGAHIVDTDVIAHKLTISGGQAIPEIRRIFGARVLNDDGSLNRQLMREAVFADSKLRLELERILHPMILKQVQVELSNCRNVPYCILVVPLLFRSKGYLELISRKIFVDCSHEKLVARLRVRSGFAPDMVEQILAGQVNRQLQLELADDVIENNGNFEELTQKVALLHEKYLLLR